MKANSVTNQPVVRSARSRTRRTAGAAAVGLVVLAGCTSYPGPKRIARDIIEAESIANPDLDEECLLAKLDTFSDSDLKTIVNDIENGDTAKQADGKKTLAEFSAALKTCV